MRLKTFLVAALLVASGAAFAQAWPAKPVKIIVPYPPGGVTDLFARVLGQQLQDSLGQPVLVENKPGASQMVGAMLVAKAPADGYTLLVGSITSLAMNAYTQKNIQYDPVKDFAPVSLGMTMPMFLVVNPTTVPVNSVKELIALLKANPGKFTFSTTGNGGSTHMAGELFKIMTGTEMTAIPYKGSAPGIADIVAGQVHMSFDPGSSTMPYFKTGKLKPLAVTGLQRFSLMPELPTVSEAGVPGFDVTAWYAMFVPARTPEAIIRKMHADTVTAVTDPDTKARLEQLGVGVVASSPEELRITLASEMAKWGTIIEEAGIKVE